MSKPAPKPTPRTLSVRDSLPPGAAICLTPASVKALVRLFGDEVLRRAGLEKGRADGL